MPEGRPATRIVQLAALLLLGRSHGVASARGVGLGVLTVTPVYVGGRHGPDLPLIAAELAR
jgi:hypothetical protein